MCIHSEKEAKNVENMLRKSNDAVYRRCSVIVMRAVGTGAFVAGWAGDVTDTRAIANVIRDLKTWHDDEELYPDLINVNQLRSTMNLPPLSAEGLPMPVFKAHRAYGYEKTKTTLSETAELARLKRNLRSYVNRQQRDLARV